MKRSLIIAFLAVFFPYSCSIKPLHDYTFLEGFTQGTTYHITYEDKKSRDLLKEINQIFQEIDSSMSIYRKNSIISGINNNDPDAIPDHYFFEVFGRAQQISKQTAGAFDITVGPLVNAWGFGYTDRMKVSSEVIDSLRQFVGYEMIDIQDGQLIKSDPRVRIDVNAIAKGYTVDLVSEFLESKGIKNYMVEIGGEVRVSGKNPKSENWRIGVDKPIDDPLANDRQLQVILGMTDIAMATSGNYRRFYVENGMKYSHTIDPFSGYPVNHNLLSATVFADKCMDADAFATAFMVMGLERSIEFVKNHSGIRGVYLIYDAGEELQTFMSGEVASMVSGQE